MGLAVSWLIQEGGVDSAGWGAALGALAAAPARSLLWALVGGGIGYTLFSLF